MGLRSIVAVLAALLSFGCAAPESVESDAPADLPPPSFGAADARLLPAIETAVARWNTAACLGLQVSAAPAHALVFGETSGGRMAETTGTMGGATIRVLDDEPRPWHYTGELLEQLVMHETAHVLAFSNDHVADGALGPGRGDGTITEATLTAVCSSANPVVVCGCFNPER